MREDADIKEAKSLKKEYDMHMRNATRLAAPKLEQDYYRRMAEHTSACINWKLLDGKQRKKVEKREDNDYYV